MGSRPCKVYVASQQRSVWVCLLPLKREAGEVSASRGAERRERREAKQHPKFRTGKSEAGRGSYCTVAADKGRG